MNAITTHIFADSGHKTWDLGKLICRCGSVQEARVHDLPPTPEAAKEVDARRIGERV